MGEVPGMEPGTVEAEALLTRVSVALDLGRWKAPAQDGLALLALAQAAARGRGPFEVALGEGLEALKRRGGLETLGRSGVGDVGQEDLDLSPGYARGLCRNAAGLRERPVLRAAVLAGEVTLRKAQALLDWAPAAEDAYWTARAKVEPVQYLERCARKGAKEDWHRVQLTLPPDQGTILELALELARLLEGGGITRLRQVECLLMEFVSSYPPPVSPFAPTLGQSWRKAPRARGEAASAGPESDPTPFDAYALLDRLKALARQRAAVDLTLRRACRLVKRTEAYRLVGAPTFRAWCSEWLGLPTRTVDHLLQLEEALVAVPEVAAALRSRRLTCQKALHVATRAIALGASPEETEALIAEAAARPAVDAQRAARTAAESRAKQMWDAGHLAMVVPTSVAELFDDALAAGRARWPSASPGEVQLEVARHFIWVHLPALRRLKKHPSVADGPNLGPCAVPGCGRQAEQRHHLWWRSHGGPDDEWNLVSLCAVHHHRCVHAGTVWVFGRSPDALTWFVGAREVAQARRLGYRHGLPPWLQPALEPEPMLEVREAA